MKETLKDKVLYWLRRLCWKDKYFVGTYWSTNDDIKTWMRNEPVIVLRVIRENTEFIDFDLGNKDRVQLARSVRVKNKQAMKQRKVHVIYVEDNAYTRLLGYKETIEHRALSI